MTARMTMKHLVKLLRPKIIRYRKFVTNPLYHAFGLAATRNGLMSFVSQLKAGKGLTLLAECIEGNYAEKTEDLRTAKEVLSFVLRPS